MKIKNAWLVKKIALQSALKFMKNLVIFVMQNLLFLQKKDVNKDIWRKMVNVNLLQKKLQQAN